MVFPKLKSCVHRKVCVVGVRGRGCLDESLEMLQSLGHGDREGGRRLQTHGQSNNLVTHQSIKHPKH